MVQLGSSWVQIQQQAMSRCSIQSIAFHKLHNKLTLLTEINILAIKRDINDIIDTINGQWAADEPSRVNLGIVQQSSIMGEYCENNTAMTKILQMSLCCSDYEQPI